MTSQLLAVKLTALIQVFFAKGLYNRAVKRRAFTHNPTGRGVHAVADAICSRRKLDWEIGLRWMEKWGAMISTTEIIAFQLLKEAGTEEFRRLSKLLK